MWPNLEVNFFVSFSTGLLASAGSVLGAFLAGYATTRPHLVLSCLAIATVVLALSYQACRLAVFAMYHKAACWSKSDPPESKEEILDPAFALLTNITKGMVRPATREVSVCQPHHSAPCAHTCNQAMQPLKPEHQRWRPL